MHPNCVIPFVGAGISVPFGLPAWSTFLKAHIEHSVDELIAQNKYEEAAQEILRTRKNRAFQDAISDTYSDSHLEGKSFAGPVAVIPRLASGPVIGTNFDHLLEQVFANYGTPFEHVVWGSSQTWPPREPIRVNGYCSSCRAC